MATEPTTVKVVYVGLRYMTPAGSTKGALSALWLRLGPDGTVVDDERDLLFRKKPKSILAGNAWVGDVYEVELANAQVKIVGDKLPRFEDDTIRAGWHLDERAAQARLASERKADAEDFSGMTLEQLKAKYRRTVGSAQRVAVLFAIHQYVTG